MSKPFKTILVAIIIVAIIAGLAMYFSGGLTAFQGNFATFPGGPDTFNTPLDMGSQNLRVRELDDGKYPEGSGADEVVGIFRVSTDSRVGATIRYGSANVYWTGYDSNAFSDPDDWVVYTVLNGKVEYDNPVGQGVEFEIITDGTAALRFRLNGELESQSGYAFVCYEDFALATNIFVDGFESGDVSLSFDIDVEGPSYNWSFVQNMTLLPWTLVEDKHGSDSIDFL